MKDNIGHLFLEGSQYFYWLIGLNIMFLVFNLPLLLALTFLQLIPANSLYFYLSLLPFGISLQAMFSCFGKVKKEKDINVFKDYYYYYKKDMKKSFAVWTILSLVIYIVILNVNFLMGTSFFALIFPTYIVLIIIFLSALICSLFIVSTNKEIRIMEIFKHSFYISIKKIYVAIFNIILFSMWLFVIFLRPVLGLGVMPSVISFMMTKNNELIFS